MEDVEQEAGAARPGAHDAPDAVSAHDTIDTVEAHAAKAAATAAPKRPKSVAEIVKLVLDKAAAEEGAPQGGSAGGGSQKAAAEGEEGAIADGTHLATGHMDVGMVRRKASKQESSSARYLAMPATSASVERLFSVAGQVVTAKRNSLHPSSVTLLVFLHEAIPGVIEREARAIIQDKIRVE